MLLFFDIMCFMLCFGFCSVIQFGLVFWGLFNLVGLKKKKTMFGLSLYQNQITQYSNRFEWKKLHSVLLHFYSFDLYSWPIITCGRYAREDTHYLLYIYDLLKMRLLSESTDPKNSKELLLEVQRFWYYVSQILKCRLWRCHVVRWILNFMRWCWLDVITNWCRFTSAVMIYACNFMRKSYWLILHIFTYMG